MKRLVTVVVVLCSVAGTWIVTKRMERDQRARLEKWGGESEMRAVQAERRADGYKRLVSEGAAASSGSPTVQASVPEPSSALARVGFPFEAHVTKLVAQLGLDTAQAQKLRGIYEKRWEEVKQFAHSKTMPAGLTSGAVSVEAAAFLSADQVRKLRQIEDEEQRVAVPQIAGEQAKQLAQTLGLDEMQTRRVARALLEVYRSPGPSAGVATPTDHVKQALRPILNDQQWQTLVASLDDRTMRGQ
jgi:hypothetical protein